VLGDLEGARKGGENFAGLLFAVGKNKM